MAGPAGVGAAVLAVDVDDEDDDDVAVDAAVAAAAAAAGAGALMMPRRIASARSASRSCVRGNVCMGEVSRHVHACVCVNGKALGGFESSHTKQKRKE
jgi:hypothetical protein